MTKLFSLYAITVALLLTSTSHAEGFTCTNKMFRDARFRLSPSAVSPGKQYVEIQDSHVDGSSALNTFFSKDIGSQINIVDVNLSELNISCSTALGLLSNCKDQNTSATLKVSGFARGKTSSARITIYKTVSVKSIEITSSLSSKGSKEIIAKVNEPVSVALDHVLVKALVNLEIEGKAFTLKYDTFYHASADGKNSNCKPQ